MRRRRRQEEEQNRERWLVSYADFITLLFAFFVVMYSISSVNEGKYKVLSASLDGIFNAAQRSLTPVEVGEPVPGTPVPAETVPMIATPEVLAGPVDPTRRLEAIADQLSARLTDLMDQGLVTLTESENWIELSLRNSLLFSSGDAVPNDEAFPLIDEISLVLQAYPNAVLVEGFTDNVPIATSVYPSNWELSSARAAAVVQMLIHNGVAPERLAAVGYGENQAIVSNSTAEGRARNRRVVLLIGKDEKVRLTMRP